MFVYAEKERETKCLYNIKYVNELTVTPSPTYTSHSRRHSPRSTQSRVTNMVNKYEKKKVTNGALILGAKFTIFMSLVIYTCYLCKIILKS